MKAHALTEFGAGEKRGYEYFYWIDFTCIDQVTKFMGDNAFVLIPTRL